MYQYLIIDKPKERIANKSIFDTILEIIFPAITDSSIHLKIYEER